MNSGPDALLILLLVINVGVGFAYVLRWVIQEWRKRF
jgi:hypothetical protein